MRGDHDKKPFLAGAIWNLAGGALILAATRWIFAADGLAPPSPPAYYHAWIALFMTFGLGYYLVYRDPVRNRSIALLGAIGKIAFAAVFLMSYAVHPGQVPRLFAIPVAGDLVFAALFIRFLARTARRGA